MEAPKKIYLVKDENTDKPMDYWYTATTDDSKVEYTRTDAFFSKAAIWFNNNLGHDECGVISYSFDTEEEMFKDFIEYMKGE